MSDTERLPLVYACSGCSSVAQLANTLAVRLDRRGRAEMSCISGVGGGVPALTRLARSGRPILALDGCALACVRACLAKVDVKPDVHLILNREGARKTLHVDCSVAEEEAVWRRVAAAIDGLHSQPPR